MSHVHVPADSVFAVLCFPMSFFAPLRFVRDCGFADVHSIPNRISYRHGLFGPRGPAVLQRAFVVLLCIHDPDWMVIRLYADAYCMKGLQLRCRCISPLDWLGRLGSREDSIWLADWPSPGVRVAGGIVARGAPELCSTLHF